MKGLLKDHGGLHHDPLVRPLYVSYGELATKPSSRLTCLEEIEAVFLVVCLS